MRVKPKPRDRWEQYQRDEKEGWFPENVQVGLENNWLGGELWHNMFATRSRMLEYAVELETKIAKAELTAEVGTDIYRTLAGPSTLASPPSAASRLSCPNAARCAHRSTSNNRPAMIVIDTNIVSELMRLTPEPAVMTWFTEQDSTTLYLTAVSEAELRTGAAILPEGRRRDRLAGEIDAMIGQDFAGRVLPFDSAAARAYAAIAASRRSAGRPILEADCQFAAIARATDAPLATRNNADFEQCGITLIDPWAADHVAP